MVRMSEVFTQSEAEEYISVYDPLTQESIVIHRDRLWEFEDAMHWTPVDNEYTEEIGGA